ncbi:hypothetical protein ACOMHN_062294 [Nucella lapillus]
MADKNQKEPTSTPLLLMSSGGLTLNPTEQPSIIPVMQSDSSLLDEEGEADSFVCQEPPRSSSSSSTDTSSTQGTSQGSMSYFQSTSTGASDPFAHVAYIPPPQPLPPSFCLTTQTVTNPSQQPSARGSSSVGGHPSAMVGRATLGQGPAVPGMPGLPQMGDSNQSSGWTPPAAATSEKPSTNIYRQKGPMRYPQPPPDYGLSSAPGLQPNTAAPPHSSGLPPPPPSGFFPAPFMNLAAGSLGASSYFPGSSSQSLGPSVSQHSQGLVDYQEVRHHWCYRKVVEGLEIWCSFSWLDSGRLEEQFLKETNGGAAEIVSTDGGRYDTEIKPRLRRAIYWEEEPFIIQRCSWFYKREKDSRYVPFSESTASFLEEEYKNAILSDDWHKRIELPARDSVVMHNPSVIVHYPAASQPDEWGNVQTDQTRPRVVKRGIEDFGEIDEGESPEVDHLVFILHGIGETCDVQTRTIINCVDEFRSISNKLIKSHFGPYAESGHIHRVEFLPVFWHKALHYEASGVDSRLKAITLPSTRKLRDFVNNTLLDILFYTSPAYCQIICDTVCQEMNRLFEMFLTRNPTFSGEISLAGHSLGGSILFDLLLHQRDVGDAGNASHFNKAADSSVKRNTPSPGVRATPEKETGRSEGKASEPEMTLEQVLKKVGLYNKLSVFEEEQIDLDALLMFSEQDLKDLQLPMGPRRKLQQLIQDENGKRDRKQRQEIREEIRKEFEEQRQSDGGSKPASAPPLPSDNHGHPSISVNYICGQTGTGQPSVHYHQLEFSPSCLFGLGSPTAVFLSVRGVESMGDNFKLPTCPRFFNIFHPAYRLEPLINSTSTAFKPVLVPHHKGRKRLHLELKESITRMGSDLKQKIMESLRSTWQTLHNFAQAHRRDSSSQAMDGEQGFETQVDEQVNSVMAHLSQQQPMDDRSDSASVTLEESVFECVCVDEEVSSIMAHLSQQQLIDDRSVTASVCSSHDEDIPMGQLNEGHRVDYVLQEAPIESFNDYLFAIASHSCYWTSVDTVLLILKEIYAPLGISPIMPGPDGRTPKLLMPPPAMGSHHPAKSLSYIGTSQSTSVPLQVLSSQTPPPPPPHPPSMSTQGHPPLHEQQYPPPTLARFPPPPPFTAAESQGGSRSGTPPVGGLSAAPVGNAGPPPISGFVRSPPQQ